MFKFGFDYFLIIRCKNTLAIQS